MDHAAAYVLSTFVWCIPLLFTAVVAYIAPNIARHTKIAEFRQAWINGQRKDVAEYLGLARKWHSRYDKSAPLTESAEDKELSDSLQTNALVVLWRIKMRINPETNPSAAEDQELLRRLDLLLEAQKAASEDPRIVWKRNADLAVAQAQLVFKTEWETTKRQGSWRSPFGRDRAPTTP